ncbi:unnamed protein product [Arabidopsis arenosa]|uniref:Uncharacterized protein n=1 Tax=Arabidopsis arenosa TaxID=38785 RepID=A0A8S2ACN3_ARAAE|nr:unnamed protein product [Arabidopsis arenosa]
MEEEEEENERRIRDIWQAIAIVFTKLEDVKDLASASLVSKEWYDRTKLIVRLGLRPPSFLKHGATPAKLSARYPNLKENCVISGIRVLIIGREGWYEKAIKIYEDMARHSLNNKLLKYGVKCHLLTAGMCHLCKADVVSITNALEKYQDLDPTFSGTRECKFLADLASAIDEEDIAKFTDVSKEFDSVTPLDAWKTTMLLRVKEKFTWERL